MKISTFINEKLRPEEKILVLLWFAGSLILLVNAIPISLGVFMQYARFFALYVALLYVVTRILFALEDVWTPKAVWLQRIKMWLYGPQRTDESFCRNDLICSNASTLQQQKRPALLSMDVELIRGLILLFLNLTIYTNIKARISIINPTIGDKTFLEWDMAIFGKDFIQRIEQWFSSSPEVANHYAHLYMHDYIWMVALMILLYMRRDVLALRWLIAAVSVTYIVGIYITLLYPSLGPCFMEPERFQWLQDLNIGRSQQWLAQTYNAHINQWNAGTPLAARAFSGIAAFPSLHVAHMVVIGIVAIRCIPLYAVFMLWMAIETFIATIGFGWHYGVDAIGGVILAGLVTTTTYRIVNKAKSNRMLQ